MEIPVQLDIFAHSNGWLEDFKRKKIRRTTHVKLRCCRQAAGIYRANPISSLF